MKSLNIKYVEMTGISIGIEGAGKTYKFCKLWNIIHSVWYSCASCKKCFYEEFGFTI